jgi:hypothetical protein
VTANLVMSDQSTTAYARKRIVQGLRGLRPSRAGAGVDRSLVGLLTPQQLERFAQLPAFDQQHLCRVANHLRANGVTERDLLTAGLLHDIGKSDGVHRVRLLDRVGKVLLKRFAPGTLARIAERYPEGRLPGLALAVRHPEVGAEIARELGCSERTCWLIRHHEAPSDLGDADLDRLQAADFAS